MIYFLNKSLMINFLWKRFLNNNFLGIKDTKHNNHKQKQGMEMIK